MVLPKSEYGGYSEHPPVAQRVIKNKDRIVAVDMLLAKTPLQRVCQESVACGLTSSARCASRSARIFQPVVPLHFVAC